MGHSDKPGDGCGGGRRQCGGNLLVDPAFGSEQQPEKESLIRALRSLRRLMRQKRDSTARS
jgi:hypothetical protein